MRFLMVVVTVFMGACSNQRAYEMIQENRRAECEKMVERQRQECLQSLQMPYDEYQRERNK